MLKITGIILARNEEKNIAKSIKSLSFCEEIIVADDDSTDQTVAIATSLKVKVIHPPSTTDFSAKRNNSEKQAANDWVLYLDADEEISPELRVEIEHIQDGSFIAYCLRRRDFFWNNELKYGETLKLRNRGLIRLVKKGSGKWVGKVHEEFIPELAPGHRVGGPLAYINHYPHPTIKEFISDINRYSSIRAQELHEVHVQAGAFEMVAYPVFKFMLNYCLYLGFLDGPAGFVYSFLMSFHSFLVRSKLYQLNTIKQSCV